MASDKEFVEYVCQQISLAGEVRCRSMFGEYGIYLDEKFISLVCDNQFFVKVTDAGKMLPDVNLASPYPGAKDWYLIDNLDDRDLLKRFLKSTWELVPLPKPKKKKVK